MNCNSNAESKDMYCTTFLHELNAYSDKITQRNAYVNELLLYFVIPLHEELKRLDTKLSEKQLEKKCVSLDGFGFEAHRRHGFKLPLKDKLFFSIKSVWELAFSSLCSIVYAFGLAIYGVIWFKSDATSSGGKSIAVIRAPATYSKMAFLHEQGVSFYSDTLCYKHSDLETIFFAPILFRLAALFVIPVYGIRDILTIFFTARKHIGFVLCADAMKYYRKRVPHKVIFEFYLDRLLKMEKPQRYYTGNKEDRFAALEGLLCRKYHIECLCIPHGLEYAYKMPMGLVGDRFYCNTLYAKEYLQGLYEERAGRFVFDKSIVEKMLSKNKPLGVQKKLVFFPESREPEKNLAIIKFLNEMGLVFFVKLHVKDSINNYIPYIDENQLITDFDDAISNSICLARKSTILIESIYNHSIPVAVLVDEKDRSYFEFMFPALKDDSILKAYTFDELKGLVQKLRKDNV